MSVCIVETLGNLNSNLLVHGAACRGHSSPSSNFGCRRGKSHLFFAVVSAVSAAAWECECP